MGNLGKMHSDHRFSKPKMGKKAYPLKKVVDYYTNEHGIVKEKLECGHEISRPQDFIGYTVARRRRCVHCYEALIHIAPPITDELELYIKARNTLPDMSPAKMYQDIKDKSEKGGR